MDRRRMIKKRLPSLISILLSGVIPTVALNVFTLNDGWKWAIGVVVAVVLTIIFVLIDVMLEKDVIDENEQIKKERDELRIKIEKCEHEMQILKEDKENIQRENSDLNKEIGSKSSEIQLLQKKNTSSRK